MKNLKYGSVCSGVEAATVAWHDLGWKPQWFSEVDKFPSAVLEHHYPDVPNYGDMTKFKEWPKNESIDLLVGGTPCQSFSVAGLRSGLKDPRGNLMLTYLSMAEQLKPKWLVWENVPGVLSSNRGRDFATFLTAMGKIGYGFAYRVLDAQYFGVPQRRRRVFVVGCLGDWRSAASVLFESESLSGHPAPSRETRKRVAPTVGTGAPYSRTGNARVEADAIVFGAQNSASQGASVSKDISPTLDTSKVPAITIAPRSLALTLGKDVASTLTSTDYKGVQAVTYALPGNWIGRKPENGGNQVEPFVELSPCQTATDVHAVVASRMRGFGDYIQDETASTIKARDHKDATDLVSTGKPTAWSIMPMNSGKDYKARVTEVSQPLMAGGPVGGNQGGDFIQPSISTTVRRMTPRECERLQGFPDDYTQISWRGKEAEECPNGHRYKAMGNSMAVPVMKWIGERIQQVENKKE
jgi:DNA (cytosine-5)-methyltransferase 1